MCIIYRNFMARFVIAVLSAEQFTSQEIEKNSELSEYPNAAYYWQREISHQTMDSSFYPAKTQQEFCNEISTELVVQFQSLPIELGPMSCSFTMQIDLETCGLRIDFLDTRMAASINKICYQDIVMILTHGNNEAFNAPFCGDLQGYSTVMKVQAYEKVQIFVLLQRPQSKWNIRLTQIKCESVELETSDACGFRNSRNAQFFTHSARSQRINSRWLSENNEVQEVINFKSLYYWQASMIRPLQYEDSATKQVSKIINGSPSLPNEFPWIVLILLENQLHCTGSLLNRRWILTAAHCTSSSTVQSPPITDYTAALGVHNRALVQEPGRILRGVINVVRHPQYEGVHFDIALLKMNESVRYNHAVRPICLPQPEETYRAGDIGIVAGWGSTIQTLGSDVLLSGPIPFVNASYCRYVWERLGVEITDSIICAGLTGSTTCEGDSGSPLVVDDHGVYRIVGVTSFGASPTCGSTVYPDVFTRVASFLDWIAIAMLDVDDAK